MSDLYVPPAYGMRRFVCECGARMTEPGVAVMHTFEGHETGIERYTLSGWQYDTTKTVEEFIVERLREKGEDVEAFVRRIKAKAEDAERRFAEMEAGVNGW